MRKDNSKRIYCGNCNCPYLECVRHDKNIPFNILILRENYILDKNNKCCHRLLDWSDEK